MSKFCGNCGTVMDDAAVVCGNCGAPLAPANGPVQKKKAAKFDASAITGSLKGIVDGVKKGDKGALLKCGIAGGVLVLVLVLIIALGSKSGEEKISEKLMKNFAKDKPEAIVKLLPTFAFEDIEYRNSDWEGEKTFSINADEGDWEDYFKTDIDDFNTRMDTGYSFDEYSIKYELIDKDVYGKENLEELADDLELYEEFDDKKLKKAVNLTYEVVYKGKGEKVLGTVTVTVIKYGSKWCVVYYSFNNASVENDELPKDDAYAIESFDISDTYDLYDTVFSSAIEKKLGY